MLNDGLRALRINALELLRQPGAHRRVDVVVSALDLDALHDSLDGDVHVDVDLEALNDGITVTGSVSVPWKTVCRRCLVDVAGVASVDVDELYQTELTDDDAFPIEQQQLDLAPMARQSILLELDTERVCREACEGLCPVCGANRNDTSCECDTTVRDDRWAALDALRTDD